MNPGQNQEEETETEMEQEEVEERGYKNDNASDDVSKYDDNDDDEVDDDLKLSSTLPLPLPLSPPSPPKNLTIYQRLLDAVRLLGSSNSGRTSSIKYNQNKTTLLPYRRNSSSNRKGGDDDGDDDASNHPGSLKCKDNYHRLRRHDDDDDDTTTCDIRGKASVLVLISSDGLVLLTKRSPKLRSHPGQVALPGGKQDPEDEGDPIRTALRETYEEVGIDFRHAYTTEHDSKTTTTTTTTNRKDLPTGDSQHHPPTMRLHIIGRLSPPVRSINNLLVTTIVACTPQTEASELDKLVQINEDEVSDWFWTPLSSFCSCSSSFPAQQQKAIQLRQEYDIWWYDGIFTYRHYDFEYIRRDDGKKNKNSRSSNSSRKSSSSSTSTTAVPSSSSSSTTTTFAITGLTAHLLYELSCLVHSTDDTTAAATAIATVRKNSGDELIVNNIDEEGYKNLIGRQQKGQRELHGQLTRYYDFPNMKDLDVQSELHQYTKNNELAQQSRSLYSKKQDHYFVLVPSLRPQPPPKSSLSVSSSSSASAHATSKPTVLHQYDSYQQFQSKGQSARKKQRLLIHPNDYTLQQIDNNNNNNDHNDDVDHHHLPTTKSQSQDHDQGHDQKQYLFQIRTTNDRICWTFGASSSEERAIWMDRLRRE